jgi:PAS domain S-box-containing protein
MEETTPAHLAAILADATRHASEDAAVVATNIIGTVVFWNERAEALFGWRTDEAVGRNILDVTPTRNSLDEATRIMEQLRRGTAWSGPFIVQRRDGTPIVVDIANYPVQVEGRVVGVVGVSRRRKGSSGRPQLSD